MSASEKVQTIFLKGNLCLSGLSSKKYPELSSYREIKVVDVHDLSDVDSAGIAYLTQIKSKYSDLNFVGLSDKILVLAHLYGLSFLLKS